MTVDAAPDVVFMDPFVSVVAGPSVLVLGGCGGSGATTTALGLASTAIEVGGAVAVDATHSGGDLGARGIDQGGAMAPLPLHTWLETATDIPRAEVGRFLSTRSDGAGVMWRDPAALSRRASFGTVDRVLRSSGRVGVFDCGAPVQAPQIQPLLADDAVRIVVTIPARADAANRLRASLLWLDVNYGRECVLGVTLVVSHQVRSSVPVAPGLRQHLHGWVRDVVEVPFDPHLATGLAVTHGALAPATRAAYARLLEGVWG